MSRLSGYWLVIVLLLAALFFTASWQQGQRHDERLWSKDQALKVQEVYHEKQKKLDNILNQIQTELQQKGGINQIRFADYLDEIHQEGIEIYGYSNDSLVFWTDNLISIPELFDTAYLSTPFLFTGNTWAGIEVRNHGVSERILGVIPVKNEYPYENEYLQSGFTGGFPKEINAEISLQKGNHNVFDLQGRFLFSMKESVDDKNENQKGTSSFLFFLIGYVFLLVFLLFAHQRFNHFTGKPLVPLWFFIADVLIIRFLLFVFRFPPYLFSTEIFGPSLFASSAFLPSFGDFALHTLSFFAIVFAISQRWKLISLTEGKRGVLTFIKRTLMVLAMLVLYYYAAQIISGLVLHSSIPLNINNVLELNAFSFIALVCIGLIWAGVLLLSVWICELAFKQGIHFKQFLLVWLMAAVAFGFIHFSASAVSPVFYIATLLFPLLLFFFVSKAKSLHFISFVFYLLFFALFTTYILYTANYRRESDERKLLALSLATEQDPVAESRFADLEKEIYKDDNLKALVSSTKINEAELIQYLLGTYFTQYWSKYKFQVTICTQQDTLLLKQNNQRESCHAFFDKLIREYGRFTFSKNLFYIDNNSWESNYIGILRFKRPINDSLYDLNIYVEISAKYIPKDLGYPELLIDKKLKINTKINRYSYARYNKEEILSRFGKFFYNSKLDTNNFSGDKIQFVDFSGYNHLVYRSDSENILLISKEKEAWLNIVAPFSYLFIYFAFVFLVFFLVFLFRFRLPQFSGFRFRLQLAFTAVIVASFVIIGSGTLYHLIQLNRKENLKSLEEKAHSILIELEHKFSQYASLNPGIRDYMNEVLIKFSKVFFSDINLYDLNGNLLASSRNELYSENLTSRRMNPLAFEQLTNEHKTFLVLNERIGKLEYTSAYVPFINNKNEVLAYLNLPYFARQNELYREISAFLVAIINLYLILVVVAIVLALLMSGFITRPLRLIRENLGNIQIGSSNQKILWKKNDEIGELILAYNKMIDELEESARLLAQSERESAWSEMARQVAHEIKNPLTPMRLSVQYLERAWADKVPDWDDRLQRFSKTLIEQIDTLAEIASAFSNFARMPFTKASSLNLKEVILNAIDLYKSSLSFEIVFNCTEQDTSLHADPQQVLRAFNNLLKNAIQAVENVSSPRIEISVSAPAEGGYFQIIIADNGCGIREEEKHRIFSPYFTTKTSGMGLGLALTKSIIEQNGGKIEFESQAGEGTRFIVYLPKNIEFPADENNSMQTI